MNDVNMHGLKPVNQQRRKLLQGAACVSAVGFAPSVFGKAFSNTTSPALSGKLICNIANPVKTLVLHNRSAQTMVIENISHGALMFDGSVINCNAACLNHSIKILANQEIEIQFDKRQQDSLFTKIDEYNRIQSRVTRLNDGTRVIPFDAIVYGNVATLV